MSLVYRGALHIGGCEDKGRNTRKKGVVERQACHLVFLGSGAALHEHINDRQGCWVMVNVTWAINTEERG